MIGSIRISLIVFNQLKLVQRSLLNSPRLVASLKGPCWSLYYSSCTSTIYVDHLINCRFAKKSNFVIFHPYQKKLDRDVMIKIFHIHTKEFVLLDQKSYIKYLGTLIDSNLTWKYHISYITSKISKTIGVIARLRQFVSSSTLLTLYRSLVSPYLLYGLTVWGQAPQIYLNQILVLQKRALRLIYFAPYRFSAVPLFVSSGFLPIGLLYFKAVSILMHDVHNCTTFKEKLTLNRTVYKALCVLELSKLLMYEFYDSHPRPKYGDQCELIHISTDRLLLETQTNNVYKDLHQD